MARFSAEAQG